MSRECIDLGNLAGFVLGELTDTRANHNCTNQSANTTNHMNTVGTCEIMEAPAYNFLFQIPQILYSTIISAVINALLKRLSLSEKNILDIKRQNNINEAKQTAKKIEKCIMIKFIIFFAVSDILLLFFWYYIACFCAVYSNTQIILIKDTLVSFSISMIYPFGLNLIPGLIRIPALKAEKGDKGCLYKISLIVALI